MDNKLIRSLHKLLVEHDCVVVPQLGAFIREQLPARQDEARRVLYPPTTTIRFNEALQSQDGLLLSDYCVSLALSQRRAKLELEQDVRILRSELVRQRSLRLEGIGTLHLSAEGRLSFSSMPSDQIGHLYYGLHSIVPVESGSLGRTHITDTPQGFIQESDSHIHLRISKQSLRYTAVAAVILFLIGLPLTLWRPSLPSYEASFVPNEQAVEKIIAEVNPHTATETHTPAEANEAAYWLQPEAGQCYVIVGTERKREVAERYISLYAERFPSIKILDQKRVYRISVASFASSEEAEALRREIAKEGIDAWVYKHK